MDEEENPFTGALVVVDVVAYRVVTFTSSKQRN